MHKNSSDSGTPIRKRTYIELWVDIFKCTGENLHRTVSLISWETWGPTPLEASHLYSPLWCLKSFNCFIIWVQNGPKVINLVPEKFSNFDCLFYKSNSGKNGYIVINRVPPGWCTHPHQHPTSDLRIKQSRTEFSFIISSWAKAKVECCCWCEWRSRMLV